MNNDDIISSSFRDPSGFLFYKNEELYRQINNSYKEQDIFDEYTQDNFEEEFTMQEVFEIKDSKRILYRMEKK